MASSSLNFDNTVAQIRSLSFSTAAPPNSALQSPAPLVLLRPLQKFWTKNSGEKVICSPRKLTWLA